MTTRAYLERTPVALAHRGGSLYAPNLGLENTMTAFGNAVGLGYTHLETDVHITRDGKLVAFHDTDLDRVSNAHGRIRDLPWSEVSHAEVGDGGHVPLLTDVLDAWPDVNLNIDLKAPGTAEPLWRLIEERGLHDQVCVGSFRAPCAHRGPPHPGGRLPGAHVDPVARQACPGGHRASRRYRAPLRQAGPRLDHRRRRRDAAPARPRRRRPRQRPHRRAQGRARRPWRMDRPRLSRPDRAPSLAARD